MRSFNPAQEICDRISFRFGEGYMFFGMEYPADLPMDVRQFFDKDALTWDEFEASLLFIRSTRPEITVGAALTFIYIARRSSPAASGADKAITISQVAKALNLSYPSAAKHCDVLSSGYGTRPGFRWIIKEEGEDKRMRSVSLSNVGVDFLVAMVRGVPDLIASLK